MTVSGSAGDGTVQGTCPDSSHHCFNSGECAVCKTGNIDNSVNNSNGCNTAGLGVCNSGTMCQACGK